MTALFKNLLSVLAFSLLLSACSDDDSATPITIDSSVPTGTFTVIRSGTLVAQSGTETAGTVEIGTDEDGENFLRFGTNFTTKLSTGTVTAFFSTSDTYTADPGNNNPDLRLAGVVASNGEQYLKLSSAVESKFTHLIIWCGSAGIPFGNTPLN